MSGSKEYFKPLRIKSMSGYDDPMGQYGIKASVVYNELRDPSTEPIDLTQRNSILIIKVSITEKNVEQIKESFPYQYNQILKLLSDKENFDKKGITKVALPETEPVPEWVKIFINYKEIINDNLKTFPCEAISIDRKEQNNVNYTNIVKI